MNMNMMMIMMKIILVSVPESGKAGGILICRYSTDYDDNDK